MKNYFSRPHWSRAAITVKICCFGQARPLWSLVENTSTDE